MSTVSGFAPPNTRRAVRSASSSVVKASRRSPSVAPGSLYTIAYAFDDDLLRGLDVPFLRDVDTLVNTMVAEDPSLARVAPEMVTRDLSEE